MNMMMIAMYYYKEILAHDNNKKDSSSSDGRIKQSLSFCKKLKICSIVLNVKKGYILYHIFSNLI